MGFNVEQLKAALLLIVIEENPTNDTRGVVW